jgi:hypothetical protein
LGKYPYILNTGNLKKFLENISKIGTPPKITQPELPKLGFKSTGDRPIVPILRFIGFLDEANAPSQSYKDFKLAEKAGAVMASALYVHSAAPESFGATASGILCSGIRFSDGCVATAGSGFPIRTMLRSLGARLKGLREFRRSH